METKPLPKSFMLISMLGLAIFGVYTLSGRIDSTWGFTMLLICGIMFVASILSMTPSDSDNRRERQAEEIERKEMKELKIKKPVKKAKKRR